MKKLLIALMTTTAALSLAATAEAADKLKACWVYTGPIGDFGYSYQHDQGRLEVEKALGDKVETAYLENVSEGPDADRAFALRGFGYWHAGKANDRGVGHRRH